MKFSIRGWRMVDPGGPLALGVRELATEHVAPTDAVVRVAGCGVCHTDLGFLFDGVRTRHPLPLTLGHEVAGVVVAHGGALARLEGKAVVVPAVLPCGDCPLCRAGRRTICPRQVFPGNDVHGGFASHVVVPGRFLCTVDVERLAPLGLELADLAVVADAVSTPYQAIRRADVARGDLAIFVGVGGVGAFGVQIASAIGARVVAVDVDRERLELVRTHGAELALDASKLDGKAVREAVRAFVDQQGLDRTRWRIFETSGSPKGQLLAYGLLTHGAILTIVGYTRQPVELRLSNLMAFDAVARGSWACDPSLVPGVMEMVMDGRVRLDPFVEKRPMSRIQETLDGLRAGTTRRRPILVPDFEEAE